MTRFAAAIKKPPDGGGVIRLVSGIAPASAPGPACSTFPADGGASFRVKGLASTQRYDLLCAACSVPNGDKSGNQCADCIVDSLVPSFKPAAVLKSSQDSFLIRLWGSGCWGHGEVIAKGRQVGVRHVFDGGDGLGHGC